jgi:diguanylate cyclase (GGDEF)-like protein
MAVSMTTVLQWFQPRDRSDAARTLGLLITVALLTTVVTFPDAGSGVAQAAPEIVAAAGVTILACCLVAVLAFLLPRGARAAWVLCPPLAVTAITLAGLGTRDATVGAQIFFLFCAVYGGALLRLPGAVAIAVMSVAGEAVLVFSLLPWPEALTDTTYVGAAIATTTYLLVRSNLRVARLVRELNRRATTDSLTGLVNRRVFDQALGAATAVAPGSLGSALILVDIDHFKGINDDFGHPGGDRVLVQLSNLIAANARRNDVVCRLGGDELAVLMPECTSTVAQHRGLEIVESVRSTLFGAGLDSSIRISVSAGVAHFPTHARTPEQLYAVADAALYEAKRAGRDCVVQQPA